MKNSVDTDQLAKLIRIYTVYASNFEEVERTYCFQLVLPEIRLSHFYAHARVLKFHEKVADPHFYLLV